MNFFRSHSHILLYSNAKIYNRREVSVHTAIQNPQPTVFFIFFLNVSILKLYWSQ